VPALLRIPTRVLGNRLGPEGYEDIAKSCSGQTLRRRLGLRARARTSCPMLRLVQLPDQTHEGSLSILRKQGLVCIERFVRMSRADASCPSGSAISHNRVETRTRAGNCAALTFPDLQRYRVGSAPPSTPTISKDIKSSGRLRSSFSGHGGQGSHVTDADAPAIKLAVSCHPERYVTCGKQ